jgi:hypothetical protein
LKQVPFFGKALKNCLILPYLIRRGGSSIFFGSTRPLPKMIFKHKFATDITSTVWGIHTTTTWLVQSKIQYEIKLRFKIEGALTASLEHEEVLSHSLLDLFSTAMLVQTIATKGANSVYPSHMKKKTFCTDVY